MISYCKNKVKSVALQFQNLCSHFPNSRYEFNGNNFIWEYYLQPTKTSKKYLLTLKYDGKYPKAYLYNQGILKSKTDYVIHTLKSEFKSKNEEYVQLCLYYPKKHEWNKYMFISETIVPWALSWLYYYEIWRVTGEWLGGGIEYGKSE